MGDDLDRLPDVLEDSRRARRVMRQNVAISLLTKAVFVVLAPLGFVTLVVAVVADMGVSLLVTLNGLRLLAGTRRLPVPVAKVRLPRWLRGGRLPTAVDRCAEGRAEVGDQNDKGQLRAIGRPARVL